MLKAFPVVGKKKSADLCAAFIAGAPRDAEGAVFWGVTDSNYKEWAQWLKSGQPWYYGDNSYFDEARGKQFRFTLGALQHLGAGRSDGARLARLGIEPMPWINDRDRSRVAVVLEQSPGFVRLLHDREPIKLLRGMKVIGERAGFKVHMRLWSAQKMVLAETFAHQLKQVQRVITLNSAGAIRAAVEGVPYHVIDPTCAAAMFSTSRGALGQQRTDDDLAARREWLGVLADNQWSVDELRSGLAWQTIHKGHA